jgi:hypothetical protein
LTVSTDRYDDATDARGPAPGQGRLTLLLIAGIPVIVILAATWMWYFVANGQLDLVGALGTANNGELLRPPRQATAAGWQSADGAPFDPLQRPAARWTLVVPQPSGACDALCEQRLFETRQIHMALGKEMGRVERMLVTPADDIELVVGALSDDRPLPGSFGAYLESEQRGLTVWHSAPSAFGGLFAELADEPASWYLMDPAGWIMMRYDPSIGYKDVISDLKFLIKNSNG